MFRSPLVVIFITIFIDLVGFGIVIPILPHYVESPQFDATPRAVGLLFASYSVMQLVFAPILGRLSDRYGRRPVLFWSIIGTGIGFLIMGSATALWMLFAGRILDGITGGNISTAQAYIADSTAPEDRAKGMGLIGAAFGLGFIFGPFIGGVLSKWGASVPFYFAAGLAFANAALLYFTLPETIKRDTNGATRVSAAAGRSWTAMRRRLADHRFALVVGIYFLFIVAFSIITTTFALYTMYRFNYSAEQNGYLFAYIGVISVFIQGVIFGRLAQRAGEAALTIAGACLLACGLFLLPVISPAYGGLTALLSILALLAVGNSLAMPSLTTLSSKLASAEKQGEMLGVMQSAASLARTLGPVVGAFLIYTASVPENMSDASLRRTFWVAATISLIACALAFTLSRRDEAASRSTTTTTDVTPAMN
jgi:MFS transporter, DHA1 family, tetracycline resistance protein